jgi:hypothetical protein
MIRKLRFRILPHEATDTLLALVEHVEAETWPDDWRELGRMARQTQMTTYREFQWLEAFRNRPWVDVAYGIEWFEIAELRGSACERAGLCGLELVIQLRRFFQDSDEEVILSVLQFVRKLYEINGFAIEAQLGRKLGTLDDAWDVLESFLEDFELTYLLDQLDGTSQAKPRSQRSEPPQPNNNSWSSKQEAEDCGSFGDESLKEGVGGFAVGGHGLPMDESAQFFVANTQLQWPCSPQALKDAFRMGVRFLHPDKNPEDVNATYKFQLFKQGYELLLERVGSGLESCK